jgi:hypothetical protein
MSPTSYQTAPPRSKDTHYTLGPGGCQPFPSALSGVHKRVLRQWEAEISAQGCYPRKWLRISVLGIDMRVLTGSLQAERAKVDATFSMVPSSYLMNP